MSTLRNPSLNTPHSDYFTRQTADGDEFEFASPGHPSVVEGTNYCTTNWYTTQESSISTYAEGEDHGTHDLCDAVYPGPVLPDVIPAAIIEVIGVMPVLGRGKINFLLLAVV